MFILWMLRTKVQYGQMLQTSAAIYIFLIFIFFNVGALERGEGRGEPINTRCIEGGRGRGSSTKVSIKPRELSPTYYPR